jgi:succinate dehydrogenase/fumarate reductase flavoprotein subunit
MMNFKWPYPIETGIEEVLTADVIVLGGGIAGCMAAVSAARKGQRVIMVEKGSTEMSGAGGSGCDHWESAATNPCSKVTPEELTEAMLEDNNGFNNGISHYIECREGYDRLLDIEKMGGKIRDLDDEFKGAAFRDEATKLMFAYDYSSRITLRVWGTTFKPAMYRELKRLGVRIMDRIMVTSLLTAGGVQGSRCIGATGINTRTGKFYIFNGKSTIMCLSRPARIWLFSSDHTGLCEFRPPQCIGDGHAMGWRAGAEFTMMEKSVRAEFSASGRSYPPYGAGNNHNTWYGASVIDASGKEIPYADRDGNILTDVARRFVPSERQSFFLKGGSVDDPVYKYRGPETLPFSEMLKKGYKLPFYADLSGMPENERKVIWGMMVGEEGKTRVPIYENYRKAGFDPEKHVLQCYGTGWTSASFLPQERQLFGLPGGFLNDWELRTSLEGLYVAGDSLYASNCYGHAAATGYYAGRHASGYASRNPLHTYVKDQAEREKERVYAPLHNNPSTAIGWKELNMGIAKTMQNYCGEIKRNELLNIGLRRLEEYESKVVPDTFAYNPHELTRLLEVIDILTVSKLILHSCLARKTSVPALCFDRGDNLVAGTGDKNLIIVKQVNGQVVVSEKPAGFFGDLKENYEKHNEDYINLK